MSAAYTPLGYASADSTLGTTLVSHHCCLEYSSSEAYSNKRNRLPAQYGLPASNACVILAHALLRLLGTAKHPMCAGHPSAGATVGGVTPLIITAIQASTGAVFLGPAVFMTVMALSSILGSLALIKYYPATNMVP